VFYCLGDTFEAQSQNLYGVLRSLDANKHLEAFALLPEETGMGLALRNRLLRAAAFRVVD